MAEASTSDVTQETEPKTVPLEALETERHKRQALETQVAELRGRVEGLDKPQEKPDLTGAELRTAVDQGRITEQDADTIRENQIEKRVEAKVTRKVETDAASRDLGQRVDGELSEYRKLVEGLTDDTSPARAKVQREFDHLISLGHAADVRTEAAACRAAFGDLATLRQAPEARDRETHDETGGGAPPAAPKSQQNLTPELKAHYSRQIDQGMYEGWDDPALEKELKDYRLTRRNRSAA